MSPILSLHPASRQPVTRGSNIGEAHVRASRWLQMRSSFDDPQATIDEASYPELPKPPATAPRFLPACLRAQSRKRFSQHLSGQRGKEAGGDQTHHGSSAAASSKVGRAPSPLGLQISFSTFFRQVLF
jgi:hypothetical protein